MSENYEKYLGLRLKKISDEAMSVAAQLEAHFKEHNEVSSEIKEKFDKLCEEGRQVRESIEAINGLKEQIDFVNNPDGQSKQRVPGGLEGKSAGHQVIGSERFINSMKAGAESRQKHNLIIPVEFKNWREALEAKATFSGSGTGLTGYDRQVGIVEVGLQRLTVRDLLAQGQTSQPTIRYIQETSHTNASTTVAEGAAKPEASFNLEEVDAPVRKIAAIAKITDETLADFPAVQSYIDNRLMFMVSQTEETQLLTGDGNSPNITGLLTAVTQAQAKGTDTAIDAIYKGITKVRAVGFFEPDGIVVHPTDWQDIRLSKDDNNNYYGGGPFSPMLGDALWGKRVVVTTAITEGTALVGAFQLGAQIFDRQGMTVEMTNSNEDDFEKNLVTIRAEERLALAIYRPLAFCEVTGI